MFIYFHLIYSCSYISISYIHVHIFPAGDDDDDEDLSNNDVVKFASGIVKSTTAYDGDRFFTMVDGMFECMYVHMYGCMSVSLCVDVCV